jgi:AhpD family alkylhydroperoxidase
MAKKLPKTYLKLKERDKAYIDAVEALGRAVKEAGPLDGKTAQLIQLAAAAAIRSEGSVHSHVRRALEAGATTEEVRHALILLTSTPLRQRLRGQATSREKPGNREGFAGAGKQDRYPSEGMERPPSIRTLDGQTGDGCAPWILVIDNIDFRAWI